MEINNYNIDSCSKEYLDRCVDNFRLNLINESYLVSRKKGMNHIDSMSIDVAQHKLLKTRDINADYNFKYRRVAYLGTLTGLLYILCGCIVYLIQNINFNPGKELGQLIIGLGAAIVVLFICLGVVNDKRRLYDRMYTLQPHRQLIIVEKWSEIEKLVSTIFKQKVITIQDVLPQLLDLCKDEVTVDEVSNVLFLRNKIVHENTMLSDFEINNTIDIENRIIALLKAKIEDTYGC